jgi:hypothetical protein
MTGITPGGWAPAWCGATNIGTGRDVRAVRTVSTGKRLSLDRHEADGDVQRRTC